MAHRQRVRFEKRCEVAPVGTSFDVRMDDQTARFTCLAYRPCAQTAEKIPIDPMHYSTSTVQLHDKMAHRLSRLLHTDYCPKCWTAVVLILANGIIAPV